MHANESNSTCVADHQQSPLIQSSGPAECSEVSFSTDDVPPGETVESPRHRTGSDSNNRENALTNFQKYGSIRPPVTLIQDEFLEKYRSWMEHHDPLKGLDALAQGASETDPESWIGYMTSIHSLFLRHHLSNEATVVESKNSLDACIEREVFRDSEQKEEESLTIMAHGDGGSAFINDMHGSLVQSDEFKSMRRFVDVLFRPGAKFVGAIQLPYSTFSRSDLASLSLINRDFKSYELIVMEADEVDELGKMKGILARHKIRGVEQCVFLEVSIVPLQSVDAKSLIDRIPLTSPEDKILDHLKEIQIDVNGVGSIVDVAAKNFSIKMKYSDGETCCQGSWNHNTLRFEGTVNVGITGRNDVNPIGGSIINGLFGGHYGAGGFDDYDDSEGVNSFTRMSFKQTQSHVFSLSPCTHNHPRGINSILLLKPMGSSGKELGPSSVNEDILRVDSKVRHHLIDEIFSFDNRKVILHRTRTEKFRKETLIKLVDLASYVDFAELARRKKVAERREKWRSSVNKYTPKFPVTIFRRSHTKSSHSDRDHSILSKKNVQFHEILASISWELLLEEASLQAEKVCATFRRKVSLLDSLTFESDELKSQTMAVLRASGISLSASHAAWDQCIQMGRTVALGWSWFERGRWGCFERSAVVGRRCVQLLLQMHSRLESNHDLLEKAYRSADGRLTMEQLVRITSNQIHRSELNNDSENVVCGICHCDENEAGAADDKVSVFLICSHSFHWGCIRAWLHDHSSCPVCRLDFDSTS